MRSESSLAAVANEAKEFENAKVQLLLESQAWFQRELAKQRVKLELAVMGAIDDEHTVSNVARAFSQSGKTPNRNAIYQIMDKHKNQTELWVGDYPFEWVPREVKTAAGKRTVHDVHVMLSDFGPASVTGEFTWRYDTGTHELEEVLGTADPYPITNSYYDKVLSRWLSMNPYPEGN